MNSLLHATAYYHKSPTRQEIRIMVATATSRLCAAAKSITTRRMLYTIPRTTLKHTSRWYHVVTEIAIDQRECLPGVVLRNDVTCSHITNTEISISIIFELFWRSSRVQVIHSKFLDSFVVWLRRGFKDRVARKFFGSRSYQRTTCPWIWLRRVILLRIPSAHEGRCWRKHRSTCQ